jgi:hypothetical protein
MKCANKEFTAVIIIFIIILLIASCDVLVVNDSLYVIHGIFHWQKNLPSIYPAYRRMTWIQVMPWCSASNLFTEVLWTAKRPTGAGSNKHNKLRTLFNKNQAAWYFVLPAQAVTWRTVAIIIRVVLVSPYLCIRSVSLSSIHYKQSRRVYINQSHQYIRLIWS